MNEYLVELYVPRGDPGSLAAGAGEMDAAGASVRHVRSIVVPEDETCYLLCEAESADAVRDAAQHAGLRFERIVRVAPEASVA
jgi:hypothetical protein